MTLATHCLRLAKLMSSRRPRAGSRQTGSLKHAQEPSNGARKEAFAHSAEPDETEQKLNPRTLSDDMEFFGTPGAIIVTFLIHATVLVIAWGHDDAFWPDASKLASLLSSKGWIELSSLVTLEAATALLGWWVFHVFLHLILPAQIADGTELRNGERLPYRLNATLCYFVSIGAAIAAHSGGLLELRWIAANFPSLAVTAMVLCDIASIGLYLWSFRPTSDGRPVMLALAGNSGSVWYDLFIGRELNPRIQLPLLPALDLKFFNELRPGLHGWILINLSFLLVHMDNVAKQTEHDTPFGLGITGEMLLVQVFQAYYVLDSAISERAILTTMDITTDGFGLMLCFGDLAWLPFTYSLQAAYLATNPLHFPFWAIALVLLASCIGLYIFRGANGQKDLFRRNPSHPDVRDLETIQTARGTRLIASSWWGLSRHINYFGDWILALAWCLCTGFSAPMTYFYAGYFAVLLVHRERRDDHACHKKYKGAWDEYRRRVPWRIVPGIY